MTPTLTEAEMRVARALKEGTGLLIAPSFWDKCAKIAIRALHTPTPEMTSHHVHGEMWTQSHLITWQAMIDAASPPETKP